MAANPRRLRASRDRVRDPALTAMLVVQCLLIFVAAPSGAAGFRGADAALELLIFLFMSLVIVVSRGAVTVTIAVFAMIAAVAGSFLTFITPAASTRVLAQSGTIAGTLVIAYVVGRAVFAPGRVTTHRVLGAVVLYLNFGLLATSAYRLIWDVVPTAFNGIPATATSGQASGSILYFSFVTLTTIGYGDIVPVDPFARALADFEGIIGQLYPATLLARLITLELEGRRR